MIYVNMDHKCFILTQEERDKIKKRNVNGEIKIKLKDISFLIINQRMEMDCINLIYLSQAKSVLIV
jgi:hypothetical protein